MSNTFCLLCLRRVFDKDDTAAKSQQKIRIEKLCKLLNPNYKSSRYHFEDDEMCDFCDDCHPLFSAMEKFKRQISLLEEKIGATVMQILTKLSDTSSQPQNDDDDNYGTKKVIQIRNMNLRVTDSPFPCPHCGKAFKNNPNLREHVQRIHTPGYVAPSAHKCPHCSKGFGYPSLLEGHIRQAHSGERPFTCEQCGKGFATKWALITHLKGAHGVVMKKKDRLPPSTKDAFYEEEEANATIEWS
ncbi:zinc finger protein OZF isoform X2 [Folsomia candida]|uniref:zinc finger protein OZF isoform X2 n=1 Tax=Folsomia candida TaxID=158441 RepID=UPI000B9063EB|nr:zinc finger protein OZF isoform X2 [Folsomia candida]